MGKITTNAYDAVGRLASITDAQTKMTIYGYTLLGQRNLTTLPDGVPVFTVGRDFPID